MEESASNLKAAGLLLESLNSVLNQRIKALKRAGDSRSDKKRHFSSRCALFGRALSTFAPGTRKIVRLRLAGKPFLPARLSRLRLPVCSSNPISPASCTSLVSTVLKALAKGVFCPDDVVKRCRGLLEEESAATSDQLLSLPSFDAHVWLILDALIGLGVIERCTFATRVAIQLGSTPKFEELLNMVSSLKFSDALDRWGDRSLDVACSWIWMSCDDSPDSSSAPPEEAVLSMAQHGRFTQICVQRGYEALEVRPARRIADVHQQVMLWRNRGSPLPCPSVPPQAVLENASLWRLKQRTTKLLNMTVWSDKLVQNLLLEHRKRVLDLQEQERKLWAQHCDMHGLNVTLRLKRPPVKPIAYLKRRVSFPAPPQPRSFQLADPFPSAPPATSVETFVQQPKAHSAPPSPSLFHSDSPRKCKRRADHHTVGSYRSGTFGGRDPMDRFVPHKIDSLSELQVSTAPLQWSMFSQEFVTMDDDLQPPVPRRKSSKRSRSVTPSSSPSSQIFTPHWRIVDYRPGSPYSSEDESQEERTDDEIYMERHEKLNHVFRSLYSPPSASRTRGTQSSSEDRMKKFEAVMAYLSQEADDHKKKK